LAADLLHRFDARGDSSAATVRITVTDSGVGIAAEKIAHLFEAFGAVVSSKAEGSGFGLAIVKEIIQQHGGAIAIKSQLENGTEFQVLLPKMSN
jgi:signal transduction histidine kinase